jgi:hypothetical protein
MSCRWCLWMVAMVLGAAMAAHGQQEAPLPPPMLSDPVDAAPVGDPPPPPTDPAERSSPTSPSTPTLPPPEATRPLLTSSPGKGPVWTGSLGAVGGAVGASAGAMLLLTGALFVLPDVVLAAVVISTPALAALVAGLVVVAMGVPQPTIDDFGSVAACSAAGCAGTWLVLLLGFGGGAGCDPGGCGDPCSATQGCDPFSHGTRATGAAVGHRSDIAVPAAAAAGLGSLVGLLVGATAGYVVAGDNTFDPASITLRASAAGGLVAGALVGGAIGGAMVGFDVEHL